MADREQLDVAAARIVDPEVGLPIGDLGMVRSVRQRWRRVEAVLALPSAQWATATELVIALRSVLEEAGALSPTIQTVLMDERERATFRNAVRAKMAGDAGGTFGRQTGGEGGGNNAAHGGHRNGETMPAFLRPGSGTRVIGVSSGKGGVGKSSVTVNLAIALSQAGQRVGILDADVYGFSVPKMLGLGDQPVIVDDIVFPARAFGVRCLSMGFFVDEDQPVIWRGPMLHKAIEQFLVDVYWGEPDFLLVDMPPGTGDVTLSLAQFMPRSEIVVVTTPQPAAQRVAQRSAFAARKLKLSVRGVIENMSWFVADDGTRYELFGSGGGATLSAALDVPLLGQIPFTPSLREGGDRGQPIVAADPRSEATSAFAALADRLISLGPSRVYRPELTVR